MKDFYHDSTLYCTMWIGDNTTEFISWWKPVQFTGAIESVMSTDPKSNNVKMRPEERPPKKSTQGGIKIYSHF